MDPREDDDIPSDWDESDDGMIRELRLEMVRLEAQLDQLLAAERERAEEIAALHNKLSELEMLVGRLRDRYRRSARVQGWVAGFWGAAIGMWLSWLLRLWQ
jgi:hypothetical protein